MAEIVHLSRSFMITLRDRGFSVSEFRKKALELGRDIRNGAVYQERDGIREKLSLSHFLPLQDAAKSGWPIPNEDIGVGLLDKRYAGRMNLGEFIRRSITAALIAPELSLVRKNNGGFEKVVFLSEKHLETKKAA